MKLRSTFEPLCNLRVPTICAGRFRRKQSLYIQRKKDFHFKNIINLKVNLIKTILFHLANKCEYFN